MGIASRKDTDRLVYAQALALNDTRRAFPQYEQCGVATLSSGTVTVTGVVIVPGLSVIHLTSNTPGGTAGFLSAPVGSRTSSQFVINSSAGADAATVDWRIFTPFCHADATTLAIEGKDYRNPTVSAWAIASASATDLPTSLTLANEIHFKYPIHIGDAVAHKAADATNVISAALPTDLASLITWVNQVKTKYNAHLTQSGVHYVNDTVNNVTASNASDQGTANTLINSIKAKMNAHVLLAPAGESINMLGA